MILKKKRCEEKNLEHSPRRSLSHWRCSRGGTCPRPALAAALCRRTPVCCCSLQALPAQSQAAPAATGVHIWFFVVSLLLLLILLEIQTSVLAQGHIEILQAKSSLGTSLLTTRTDVWTPGPACGPVIFILYEVDLGFLLVIFWWAWKEGFSVTPSKNSVYDHTLYFDYFHNMGK